MKTSTKKKLYITFGSIGIALVVAMTSVVIVLATRIATIQTDLNIRYTSSEVAGRISASYIVNDVETAMTTSSGGQTIEITGEEDSVSETLSPESSITLTKSSDNVVFKYAFTNKGTATYWAIVDYTDTGDTDKNYSIAYSTDETNYSTENDGLEVAGHAIGESETDKVYYYIKVSIASYAKDTIFTGNFNWTLTTTKPENFKEISDLQLATDMNNAFITYGSTINNLTDALYVLSLAGYTSFDTEVSGRQYLYDSVNKKVLYVDADYNVLNLTGYNSADHDQWLEMTYSETEITNNSSNYGDLFKDN